MVQIMCISTISTIFFALATLATAADITGYQKADCCTTGKNSASWKCANIPEGRCCNFKTFEVDSIRWTIPATSSGFAYNDVYCHSDKRLTGALIMRAEKSAITNKCFNYKNSTTQDVYVKSARWVNDRKVVDMKDCKKNQEDNHGEYQDPDCMVPNVVTYIDGFSNKEYHKSIPAGMSLDVQAWYEAGDYEQLGKLKDYKN